MEGCDGERARDHKERVMPGCVGVWVCGVYDACKGAGLFGSWSMGVVSVQLRLSRSEFAMHSVLGQLVTSVSLMPSHSYI